MPRCSCTRVGEMTSLITVTGRVPNTIVAGWCLDSDAFSCKFLSVPHWKSSHTSPWSFTLQAYFFKFAFHLCADNFGQKAGVACLLSMQNPKTSSSLATNWTMYNLNREWDTHPLESEALLHRCTRKQCASF